MQPPVIIRIPAVPPSANRIWRKGQENLYLTQEAVAFYNIVAAACARIAPPYANYYDVEIVITPVRKAGDVDNRIKPTLDALTKARFWSDDDRVARVTCSFAAPDKNKKGCTVVYVRGADSKYPFIPQKDEEDDND